TKEIGVIREIEDNPAHPILVVDRGEGRDEVLIPFVSDFIEFSDNDKKHVIMNLPGGLVDIDEA
ncbi:MAG: 16S rRNA processing protein RimM, partial [Eggerthellaceae bacterium]